MIIKPPISFIIARIFLSESSMVLKTEGSERATGDAPPGHVAQNLHSRHRSKVATGKKNEGGKKPVACH